MKKILFYVICIFFSKEIFEFKNKEIKIKKYFLFFCYFKKTIKIKEIVKIKYISTGGIFSVILSILLAGIFFKIINRDRANIYFLEEENESYNI